MMNRTDLIKPLTRGKKIEFLGSDVYSAIDVYKGLYNKESNDDIDIEEILSKEFDTLVFDNEFIRLLTLDNQVDLEKIYAHFEKTYDENNISDIRNTLILYFNIQIADTEADVIERVNESNCEVNLHDFQERIRRKVINLMFSGQKRILVHMPTGAGKTRTAVEILIDFIRFSPSQSLLRENFKILWVAQSSELCTQAFETFKYIYDKKGTHKMKIGHYYGGFDNVNEEIINSPAIIFCGIQKLLSNYQHDIWTKIKNETYLVIIDEAHRSVAQQWVNALNYFVDNVNVNLLGLTATPGLGAGGDDTYRLATYYNNCKITLLDSNYAQENNPIQTLTEQGFLAKIKRFNVDNIFDDNDPLATVGEDTNGNIVIAKRSLNYLSKLPSRNRSIINIIKDANVQNKKMLVFTCSVAHNKILQYLLREEGIHAESIDANTKNREQIIEAFKNGDLNILLNFGVLTTGFDAPKTNVCIIARPIESIVMYSQMVGRILRGPLNGKGNNENELYTIRDNFKLGAYENLFTSFDEFYK